MLASTVQFSTNNQPTTPTPPPAPNPQPAHRPTRNPNGIETKPCLAPPPPAGRAMALKQQPPTGPTADPDAHPHPGAGTRLLSQDPTGCSPPASSRTRSIVPHHPKAVVLDVPAVAGHRLTSVSAHEHPDPTTAGRGLLTTLRWKVLLRKEVIQPHLPVRLPCYDFVPIASPTFDGSLPHGLGHRLRVLPTFVT
jgi:hypothetical protein